MTARLPVARPAPPDRHTLPFAIEDARVKVNGYFYIVDFGPDVRTPLHRVGKDRRCSCSLGMACLAVNAVAEYLKSGGERAPDPPPGYYPVAPAACPICGAAASYDSRLSSKHRGAGWRCRLGGAGHYWQAQTQALRQRLAQNPWLFPPVVVREGSQMNAFAGILPGDRVLYPGLKRAEIGTALMNSTSIETE